MTCLRLPAVLCFTLAASMAMAEQPNVTFRAADFIGGATARQIGSSTIEMTLTIRNPTAEQICIYPGIIDMMRPVTNDADHHMISGYDENEYADPSDAVVEMVPNETRSPVEHQLAARFADRPFDPALQFNPGESYVFTQIMTFGQYALYKDEHADGGLSAAPKGSYLLVIYRLQVFRCDRITPKLRKGLKESWIKGGLMVGQPAMSETNPDGAYWDFEDVVTGAPFQLDIAPPKYRFSQVFLDIPQ
ncbi:hypothetical protein ACTTAI_13690 [Rhodobacter capsulatus]|uniref:hypothetical protein n=1 Tax=Rhodobacter capsulatus TaxID=1061 RepID=UPI004025D341